MDVTSYEGFCLAGALHSYGIRSWGTYGGDLMIPPT